MSKPDKIEHLVDPSRPTPLTPEQKAELEALRAMPDETIDTSDLPPLMDAFWREAVRNPFDKPTKTSTTVRIDFDVLLWLRSQGPGYQSRINAILRRAMLEEPKKQRDGQTASTRPCRLGGYQSSVRRSSS